MNVYPVKLRSKFHGVKLFNWGLPREIFTPLNSEGQLALLNAFVFLFNLGEAYLTGVYPVKPAFSV